MGQQNHCRCIDVMVPHRLINYSKDIFIFIVQVGRLSLVAVIKILQCAIKFIFVFEKVQEGKLLTFRFVGRGIGRTKSFEIAL